MQAGSEAHTALTILLVRMWRMMFVSLRTGEMFDASAAGFAVVSAAILFQDDSPPQIARQLGQLFRQRHGLVEVRQEVAKRGSCHTGIIAKLNKLFLRLTAKHAKRTKLFEVFLAVFACFAVRMRASQAADVPDASELTKRKTFSSSPGRACLLLHTCAFTVHSRMALRCTKSL